jgi:hypothetical protein
MNDYFYEVFENIPRQGPGLNAYTRKAFGQIEKELPEIPEILDIGCGKGMQTLELARLSQGAITAVDNSWLLGNDLLLINGMNPQGRTLKPKFRCRASGY